MLKQKSFIKNGKMQDFHICALCLKPFIYFNLWIYSALRMLKCDVCDIFIFSLHLKLLIDFATKCGII